MNPKNSIPQSTVTEFENEVSAISRDLGYVYCVFDDEDTNLILNGFDGVLYQAYLTYIAISEYLDESLGNDVIKKAFDIVGTLKNDHTKHLDQLFLTSSYRKESYIEAFHRSIDEVYLFEKKLNSVKRTNYGSRRYSLPKLSDYQKFLCSILGDKGGKVLDLCAEYLPSDFSFDGYNEYTICESDEKLFAFYTLRKAIEGNAWKNVFVTKEIPHGDACFDLILTSTSSLHSTGRDSLRTRINSILSDNGKAVIQSYNYNEDCGTVDPRKLEMSLSVPDTLRLFHYLFVINKSKDLSAPIVFVDGQSFYGDNRVTDPYWFFSKELTEMIGCRDCKYVVEVPCKDIVGDNYYPGFYLLCKQLTGADSVLLGDYIRHYGEDEMMVFEDYVPGEGYLGNCFEISSISTDPRLIETRRTDGFGIYNSCSEYWLDVEEPGILLVQSEVRMIDVGYLTDTKGALMKVSIAGTENNLFGGRFDGVFGLESNEFDIQFVTHYLRSLPLKTGVDYFSAPWDIMEVPIPHLSLEKQRLEVKTHLTQLANSYLKSMPDIHKRVNVIVMLTNAEIFKSHSRSTLEKLNMNVLKYVTNGDELESAIKMYNNKDVAESKHVDAVLVSVDIPQEEVVHAVIALSNTEFRSYFFSMRGSFDQDSLSFSSIIRNRINDNFVPGTDYLEEIRRRINVDSFDILDEYPEYQEFFKAAMRFDEEYPEWRLWDYAKRVLSKKPIELDINDFRSKIDETIGRFFRDNNVVPQGEGILPNGAIPDLLFRPPYENREKKIKISLYEHLDKEVRKEEEWIRSAYVTIRKLGNNVSHNSREKTRVGTSQSIGLAAFTLFTEIFIWLNKDEVRERYQSGNKMYVVSPIVNEQYSVKSA